MINKIINTIDNMVTPSVTVVVPVYNDPVGIRMTLDALVEQDYHNYEVVVVDNGSTDETRNVIKEYLVHENIRMLVEDKIQGSYAARNKGIRNSAGDFIAFLDADITVEQDWLSTNMEFMISNQAKYVGCNVKIYDKEEETFFSRYRKAIGFPIKRYIEIYNFSPTCCLFIERTLIDEVGLFDYRLMSGGDKEFGNRVYESGIKLYYNQNSTVYHPARKSFSSLAKRYIRIGTGSKQKEIYYQSNRNIWERVQPFLPPHPKTIPRRAGNTPLSATELVLFYLLETVLKSLKLYGRYRA